MDISAACSVLAAIFFAISSFFYIVDTARAKIRPSIATFGILTLVNFSQLVSLVSKQVWHVVPFTTIGLLQAAIVFVLALRSRQFYFKLADKIALGGALIGFIVWLLTKDAAYNLYIINAVTAITFVPLIIKAFKEPALETFRPWSINLIASILLVFAVDSTAAVAWIVPARQFICSLLINIGLLRGAKPAPVAAAGKRRPALAKPKRKQLH
jgi:magnesium-transporting ATPase (P-type)